jgi:hypothetical protein
LIQIVKRQRAGWRETGSERADEIQPNEKHFTLKRTKTELERGTPKNTINMTYLRHSCSVFGPKREEDGSWRKLHSDELHDLYSSPNTVRVIKSRRIRWAGRGTHGGGEKCLQGFGWEAQKQETTGKT